MAHDVATGSQTPRPTSRSALWRGRGSRVIVVGAAVLTAIALGGDSFGRQTVPGGLDAGQRSRAIEDQLPGEGGKTANRAADRAIDPADPGASDPDGPASATGVTRGRAGVLRIAPLQPIVRDGFRMEGGAEIERVFGDSEDLKRSLDRFYATIATMDELRQVYYRSIQDALVAMDYLTPTPASDADPRTTRPRRSCPPAVAVPYAAARRAGQRFRDLGDDFERDHNAIRDLHRLGESAGLTPDYRWKINRVSASYQAAVADYREMRITMLRQLAPELRYRRCQTDTLLALAARATDPPPIAEGGGPDLPPDPPAATAPVPAPRPVTARTRALFGEPAPVTFFVDNRACQVEFELVLSGEYMGRVPAGQQVAFQSPVGPREMCLLVSQPGDLLPIDDPEPALATDAGLPTGLDAGLDASATPAGENPAAATDLDAGATALDAGATDAAPETARPPALLSRCGQPGTVRSAYIHDGWSLVTNCQ